MKTQTTENQIASLGWEIERDNADGTQVFRAHQGGFKTLWRMTPGQVLVDVKKIVNARKDPSNQRVPF